MPKSKVKNKANNNPLTPSNALPSNPLDINTDDIFEMKASFSNLDSDNAAKFFMEAPKDVRTNILRANIRDSKLLSKVILSFDRYDKYHQTRHKESLINYLIGTRAIGGFATIQAQQVAIQIMAEQLMLHMTGAKLSRAQQKQMEQDIDQQMKLRSGKSSV